VAAIEAVRCRCRLIVIAYVAGWAAVMAPWLGKNMMDTENPVYPLGYSVFGGEQWGGALNEKGWGGQGPQRITSGAMISSLIDVAGRSDWQSPLYVALAPLALIRRGSRRLALGLWGYVGYLFLTWWFLTHRLDRFWIPLLPALASLAG